MLVAKKGGDARKRYPPRIQKFSCSMSCGLLSLLLVGVASAASSDMVARFDVRYAGTRQRSRQQHSRTRTRTRYATRRQE